MAAARSALPGRPPRADRRITPARQGLALAVWSDRSGWHSGHWSAAGAEAAGGPRAGRSVAQREIRSSPFGCIANRRG